MHLYFRNQSIFLRLSWPRWHDMESVRITNETCQNVDIDVSAVDACVPFLSVTLCTNYNFIRYLFNCSVYKRRLKISKV